MAFLVLIMGSFASLTRVEIQIAANQQRLEKVRQNALFGLRWLWANCKNTQGRSSA